jgi:hypothetical protein
LDARRDREETLKAQLLATTAELTLERQRLPELRDASEACSAEASTARAQVASLKLALDCGIVEADIEACYDDLVGPFANPSLKSRAYKEFAQPTALKTELRSGKTRANPEFS